MATPRTLYFLNSDNGDIHFPDGFILSCPYDDPRYLEYAAWVQAGNVPDEIHLEGNSE